MDYSKGTDGELGREIIRYIACAEYNRNKFKARHYYFANGQTYTSWTGEKFTDSCYIVKNGYKSYDAAKRFLNKLSTSKSFNKGIVIEVNFKDNFNEEKRKHEEELSNIEAELKSISASIKSLEQKKKELNNKLLNIKETFDRSCSVEYTEKTIEIEKGD